MPEVNPSAVGPLTALWWPFALPETNRVYSLDLADAAQLGDAPARAELCIAPSGPDGELEAVDLSANGYTLLAQLTGGFNGREYRCKITVTGASGAIYQYVVNIRIGDETLIAPPLPDPPVDPGFGDIISWTSGVTVLGPAIAAVATGLVGVGTNQATALPLPAVSNIIASVPTGTGFVLDGDIVSGTVVIQNDDADADAPIYPPFGARINDLDVNAPFILGRMGARLNFTTNDAATQWYAG